MVSTETVRTRPFLSVSGVCAFVVSYVGLAMMWTMVTGV
jgi:hypothetical protein